MKNLKSILILFFAFSLGVILHAQKVGFKMKGSDTVLPLAQKQAELFMKKNSNTSIMVTGGGSGVGISALFNGTADIALSSRRLKQEEKIKLTDTGKAFQELIVAYDALAVIVHPDNKVSALTREQLAGIFAGKFVNWKELGGDDLPIVVYSRETSSGSYAFIKQKVLKNKNFTPKALLMPATGAIIQSVSQTKGAIGYVGLAYLEYNVKPLKVSFNKGQSFIEPKPENARNKQYPITRPLFFYYLVNSTKKITPFLEFVLSAEGQRIVEHEGYIPVN